MTAFILQKLHTAAFLQFEKETVHDEANEKGRREIIESNFSVLA